MEGDFGTAREHLRRALADRSAADPHKLDATWRIATDPITAAHNYLALMYLVHGDLDRAKADIAEAVRRSDSLGYPQNAYNRALPYFIEIWVCLEASHLAEAATLVAGLRQLSEQSGLGLSATSRRHRTRHRQGAGRAGRRCRRRHADGPG